MGWNLRRFQTFETHQRIDSLTMSTCPPHFLFVAVFFPIVMAVPDFEFPTIDPPEPPFPPMDEPIHDVYPVGNNVTDPMQLEAYCQMLLQAPNPVPPEEIPWFCMCTKCQSNPGPKGDRGDRGLPGNPGSPGRKGPTGYRGPPGFNGRQGIKGQKGDEGEKGQRGLQGLMGPKGGRGFKGDKGDKGFEGRPGDPGPKGDDGVCPDACESSLGPPGPPGLPGPAGPRGLPGVQGLLGLKGIKGDMGDLGHPGVPGLVGEKGELGPQGDCNCTDGVDGTPGQMGNKGDKGEQGQMGPKGQTGPQGFKGDMGEMGMMGIPGPCMPSIQSSFAARLTSSYPPPNAPVVFAYIFYNIQGSYNPSRGIYTAPVNGTYVFSYHLCAYERVLKVGLFLNYKTVVKTTEIRDFGITSQLVVLHLSRGDRVWIQVKDIVTNGMFANSESTSTFSGFLLHPDTCDMPLGREYPGGLEDYESGDDDDFPWDN